MSNKIKSEQQPCSDGEEGPLLQNHPLALLGCISPSSPTPYLTHPLLGLTAKLLSSSRKLNRTGVLGYPEPSKRLTHTSRKYEVQTEILKSEILRSPMSACVCTHTYTWLPFPVIFKVWSAVSDGSGIPVPWNFKILIWGDIFKME